MHEKKDNFIKQDLSVWTNLKVNKTFQYSLYFNQDVIGFICKQGTQSGKKGQFFILLFRFRKFLIVNFVYYFSNLKNFLKLTMFPTLKIFFNKFLILLFQLGKFFPTLNFYYCFSYLKNFLTPNFLFCFSNLENFLGNKFFMHSLIPRLFIPLTNL